VFYRRRSFPTRLALLPRKLGLETRSFYVCFTPQRFDAAKTHICRQWRVHSCDASFHCEQGTARRELGDPSAAHGFPARILGVTPDIQAGSVTGHWVDLFTLFGKQALNTSGARHEKSQAIAVPVNNLNHSWFGAVRLTVAIGIAYFLAARLGLALLAQVGVAIFWPAAGIATGVLIALGPKAVTRSHLPLGVRRLHSVAYDQPAI
jgi:hypothetical protein